MIWVTGFPGLGTGSLCFCVVNEVVLISSRPEFCDVERWLESLLLHLEVGLPLPSEMMFTLLPGTLMRKISEASDS